MSRLPLPGAVVPSLDCRARVGERTRRAGERKGRVREHPVSPLRGRHRSSARPPPPANSGPSHGDQSARGWLGGKPREAFIAARVAARSCQDSLLVLQPNGLAQSPPGETPPCGRSPACPAVSKEIKWRLGGHPECSWSGRLCSPTLASFLPTWSIPSPPPALTLAPRTPSLSASPEGGHPGRHTDARALTGRPRAGGATGGGWGGAVARPGGVGTKPSLPGAGSPLPPGRGPPRLCPFSRSRGCRDATCPHGVGEVGVFETSSPPGGSVTMEPGGPFGGSPGGPFHHRDRYSHQYLDPVEVAGPGIPTGMFVEAQAGEAF